MTATIEISPGEPTDMTDGNPNDRPLRSKLSDLLPIMVILLGTGFLYYLGHKGVIELDSLISSIVTIAGWFVALWIALIHLRRNRTDSLSLHERETRQRLEIEAFTEANKGIGAFSETIGHVSVAYWTWPGKLRLRQQYPSLPPLGRADIDQMMGEQIIDLLRGEAQFALAIEAHEIVVLRFNHLRTFIQLKTDDLRTAIGNLREELFGADEGYFASCEGLEDFGKKCEEMGDLFVELQSYLHDYRVELMNSLLGEVFETKVPRRKPMDSKFKVLTDIAEKEEVEREMDRRQKALLEKPSQ